jgi:hypothetical protein
MINILNNSIMNKKSNTKPSLTFLVLLFISSIINSQTQTVQVNGKLQVSNVPTNATATDMIVIDGAGNLGKKPAPSDNQSLSVSSFGDTLKLQNGGFLIIPGISALNASAALNVFDGDGNSYRPVKINNLILLPQSRATKYNDGTPIPKITDNTAWAAATGPAYSWYNNDSIAFGAFGPFYNGWVKDPAMNGGKNVCPVGYHVMTKAEYLSIYLNNVFYFKDSSSAYWDFPGYNFYNLSLKGTGQRQGASGAFMHNLIVYFCWFLDTNTQCGQFEGSKTYIQNYPPTLKHGLNITCAKD